MKRKRRAKRLRWAIVLHPDGRREELEPVVWVTYQHDPETVTS